MNRRRPGARALVWGAACALAAAATVAAAAQEGAGPDGGPPPFTTAQAERGAYEYGTRCAHCHRGDLLGDDLSEVPSLAGDTFFVRWADWPVADFYRVLREDMPLDAPGTMSVDVAEAIFAYVLQVNGYPAGAEPLRSAADEFDDYVFEVR